MRSLLLVFALALALQEQPPPGNPNHEAPPEGWHCFANTPTAPAPDGHACVCHEHRTCVKGSDGKNYVIEHDSCRVYCFKDSCRCPVHCEDTE